MTDADLKQYSRPGVTLPFCPGCGHRSLLRLILRAIDELGINIDDMLFVSGIGCGGWIASPCINADTLHTLHGRALAFATGAKMFNPKLKTMVISGDGDLIDIGGNHLIHAARRNMALTTICADNMNYGQTGGQACSTTPKGAVTQTTHEGNPYYPFDICKLVNAAGAAYTARYLVTQTSALVSSIKKALQIEGFSFIDVISPCPTQFGRQNRLDTAKEAYKFFEDRCITKEDAEGLSPAELQGKIITGEFSNGRS